MLISVIVSLLAYFLHTAIPIGNSDIISFVAWCIILFLLLGAGYAYQNRGNANAGNRWLL